MGKFNFETIGRKITNDMRVGDYVVTLQTSSSNQGGWFELIMPPGFFHEGIEPNKVQTDLGLKFSINDNRLSVLFSKYSSLEMLKLIIDKAIDQISNGVEAKLDPMTNELMFSYEYEKAQEEREDDEDFDDEEDEYDEDEEDYEDDEYDDEISMGELEDLPL